MIFFSKSNWLSRQEISQVRKGMDSLSKKVRTSQTISAANPTAHIEKVDESEKYPSSENPSSMKQKVLGLVKKYRKEVNEEDLPKIIKQMNVHFDAEPKDCPIYRYIDLTKETDARVIMVGDTHCDYNSVASMLEKIALSPYDYFGKGYIVFDGDYLDRGSIFFEYFLLLLELKKLLGSRCILMRGNHDTVVYDKFSRVLEAQVNPCETTDFLNQYCWRYPDFLEKLSDYFTRLPYYVMIKNKAGVDMIVHGGIPHNNYLEKVHISIDTGAMTLDTGVVLDNVLYDFIWSDPYAKEDVRFQQMHSRFGFGKKQFDTFADNNGINRIFRSHEPVNNGVKAFFDDRLFTVFSNGGVGNAHTGYPNVTNPVFAIIKPDGDVLFESIHFKRISMKGKYSFYSQDMYMGGDAPEEADELDDLHLNEEFFIINQ